MLANSRGRRDRDGKRRCLGSRLEFRAGKRWKAEGERLEACCRLAASAHRHRPSPIVSRLPAPSASPFAPSLFSTNYYPPPSLPVHIRHSLFVCLRQHHSTHSLLPVNCISPAPHTAALDSNHSPSTSFATLRSLHPAASARRTRPLALRRSVNLYSDRPRSRPSKPGNTFEHHRPHSLTSIAHDELLLQLALHQSIAIAAYDPSLSSSRTQIKRPFQGKTGSRNLRNSCQHSQTSFGITQRSSQLVPPPHFPL